MPMIVTVAKKAFSGPLRWGANWGLRRRKPVFACSIKAPLRRGEPMPALGRRELITLIGAAATWSLAARARQPAMLVVGFFHGGSSSASCRRCGRAGVVMWSRPLALALLLLPAPALAGVKEKVAALAPPALVLVMDAKGNELVA